MFPFNMKNWQLYMLLWALLGINANVQRDPLLAATTAFVGCVFAAMGWVGWWKDGK